MAGSKDGLKDRLARYRQIKLGVIGRKSGQTISIPVWFVLEDTKLYLLPVQGSNTQWYRNVLKSRSRVPRCSHHRCQSCEVGGREVPGEVRGKDVKKYYSKFDVAVCLRRCDGPRDPCRSPAGTGRATKSLWQVSSSCRSYAGGKPDCVRRFGVKLKNVRAARSTSVEAFRLRSPQARLPPAKDRAGFGEGVLRSHTPTDHSLFPRTSSQYHSAASDATQLHPQAHANFG